MPVAAEVGSPFVSRGAERETTASRRTGLSSPRSLLHPRHPTHPLLLERALVLVLVARLRLSLPSPRAVRLAKLGAQVLDLFVGEAGVAEAVEALEGGDLRGLAVGGDARRG